MTTRLAHIKLGMVVVITIVSLENYEDLGKIDILKHLETTEKELYSIKDDNNDLFEMAALYTTFFTYGYLDFIANWAKKRVVQLYLSFTIHPLVLLNWSFYLKVIALAVAIIH